MKISVFLSENFQFLELKFSIYLNRYVFVMYQNCIIENNNNNNNTYLVRYLGSVHSIRV